MKYLETNDLLTSFGTFQCMDLSKIFRLIKICVKYPHSGVVMTSFAELDI